MKPKLTDLTVMITRPQHQAEKLCQMIDEQGGKVIRFPALAIEPMEHPGNDEIIATFNEVEIAIFISANAVFYGMSLWQHYHSLWPADCVVLAIGEATAQALQNHGLGDVRLSETQYTTENLLQLVELQHIKGKRVVLFRGEGGRRRLATELQQRGADLQEVICYQRILPKIDAPSANIWQNESIDIIICTSVTAVHNLFTLLGDAGKVWLQSMPWLVVSERIAIAVHSLGVKQVPVIANNASDAAIVAALTKRKQDG